MSQPDSWESDSSDFALSAFEPLPEPKRERSEPRPELYTVKLVLVYDYPHKSAVVLQVSILR